MNRLLPLAGALAPSLRAHTAAAYAHAVAEPV
ncbi:hypothetical protein [Azospirillum doebereinerae]